ncbi:MAG TPA: hypothetical protein VGC97_17730 [Pyrinomonadaceae bacterium]|jgi:hypothetical protein
MNGKLAIAGAILLSVGSSVFAHRLDEYLQATTILVSKNNIQAEIRLTPGVKVFPVVLVKIDTDKDGSISEAEQRDYAQLVLDDLSLAVDGNRLPLQLASLKFPNIEEMKKGDGEIQLYISADVPPGEPDRKLTFENHHQSDIAVYLVNSLYPNDPGIRITGQNRNHNQSYYQMDYVQSARMDQGEITDEPSLGQSSGMGWLVMGAAVSLLALLAWLWHQKFRTANDGSG